MTAEELMLQRLYVTNDGEPASIHDNFNTVEDTMVEFANYHVEQALKKAMWLQDPEHIKNCYPLENIK